MSYVEADGTDVRVNGVYVYSSEGRLVKTYLRDTMGVRFADNLPNVKDDYSYLNLLMKDDSCDYRLLHGTDAWRCQT
jgi:hypothetical protein